MSHRALPQTSALRQPSSNSLVMTWRMASVNGVNIDHAGSHRLGEVVEDCPRDPVDVAGTRDRDESVFDGLGVRVGGNYFAEDLVGEALRLLSCVYEIE